MSHTLEEVKKLRSDITVRNMLTAGTAGGVGLASLMGVIEHLKRLNEIKDTKEEQEKKTNRLRKAVKVKVAEVSPTAITAMAVAGVGSLVLTKKLITQALLRNDKRALDELKARYTDTLKERSDLLTNKTASEEENPHGRGFTSMEGALSATAALPILITLGTAIAANQYLKHLDPVRKDRERAKEEGVNVDALKLLSDKVASFTLPVVLALQLKKARTGPVGDLIGTVVEGNGKKLAQAIIRDPEAALDSIQGAHVALTNLDEAALIKAAADAWAAPSIAPTIMLYTKAELDEHFPFITKIAAVMADDDKLEIQEKIMSKLLEDERGTKQPTAVTDVPFVDAGEESTDT